ncbi:MAG: CCA tRNA nucleotidyltransferase [Clostridia bacterium]
MLEINLSENVEKIITSLNENGYKGYVVGGAVRDGIMNEEAKDVDLCTDAKPEEVIRIFKNTFSKGIKHGTVSVKIGEEFYEITTFRKEDKYTDLRRPDNVVYIKDINEDLKRRDFTINAMAYNKESGLIDLFGGVLDIKNKLIRCVGNPDERFSEDALRMIRAIRFAATLNFKIEEKTYQSIEKNKAKIKYISVERLKEEFTKIIVSDNLKYGMDIMKNLNIINIPNSIIEEAQNIKIVDKKELLKVRIICMLKFLPIDNVAKILEEFKFSNKQKSCILNCIKLYKEIKISTTSLEKKYIRKLASQKEEELLIYLQIANNSIVQELEKRYFEIKQSNEIIRKKDLKVNGKDILQLGINPEDVGICIDQLLEQVYIDPTLNSREKLIEIIKNKS